jgi:protein gp37
VTAENQQIADARIPILFQIPAAKRFVSIEPMLKPIQLGFGHNPLIDWVIVGGETGPGARLMDPDWARSIREQCKAAGAPFFMKQMTNKASIPDDLMIREYPE